MTIHIEKPEALNNEHDAYKSSDWIDVQLHTIIEANRQKAKAELRNSRKKKHAEKDSGSDINEPVKKPD